MTAAMHMSDGHETRDCSVLYKSSWLIVFSQTADRMVNVLQTFSSIYILKLCICLDLSQATAGNHFYALIIQK